MTELIELLTQDKLTLAATLFIPRGQIKAGVILNSATAVKQSYYENFARYLMEQGYLVITYDYRGIGKSAIANPRDKRLTMQAWGEHDLATVIDWATTHYQGIDWHCIGHSVGGQLIGLAGNNTRLKSIYCVSAQSGYWKNWETFNQPKILLMWYAVIPGLSALLGKIPGALLGGEPLPEGIARQWAYWGRNKDYIVDKQGTPIRDGFARITCAMKFLLIEDDLEFAPPRAVAALKQFYANADSQIELINPRQYGGKSIGHFGFFKKEYRETLWQDALQWLNVHVPQRKTTERTERLAI